MFLKNEVVETLVVEEVCSWLPRHLHPDTHQSFLVRYFILVLVFV